MKPSHRVRNDSPTAAVDDDLDKTSWRAPLRVSNKLAGFVVLAVLAAGLSFALTPAEADAAGPHQVVVRAKGKTGQEEMALRINGEDVARWPVTSESAAYTYEVSSPVEVAALEVVFINDDGPRDLLIDHVNVGGLKLKSDARGTISTGTYVSGEGCKSRESVSTMLHCNGSFSYPVPPGLVLGRAAQAGPQVTVRAKGNDGSEQLQIRINDEVVASATVDSSWMMITADLPAGTDVVKAEVQFVNDGKNRDLRVDYLEIDGRRFESESSATRALGTWASSSCAERQSDSEWLRCSGWFRYDVTGSAKVAAAETESTPTTTSPPTTEAPATTIAPTTTVASTTTVAPTTTVAAPVTGDVITVKAKGRTGDEEMHLRLDGHVVKAWSVTTTWQTFTHTVDDADSLSVAEVQFVNDGGSRDLRVDYLEIAGTTYQAESSATRAKGSYTSSTGCNERQSTSEWLHCSGWFRFSLHDASLGAPAPSPSPSPSSSSSSSSSDGSYTIAQVIDGTIGAGDGSNPNEEAPMGRHDAPLYLPQGWNWAQGPTRNSVWGQLGTGGSKYAEWRCAVIPEYGHRPSVPFRVNVREGAYYQFVSGNWNKGFDVDLTGGNHGGYLGTAGQVNTDPFGSGSHGQIEWRRESDGSYSAPWNSSALMMHFWAGQRKAPASGQTAEFLTSEVRLQQPDGQRVDLSQVKVLFQCGVDYYNTQGGQGTKVPGPGIAKYHRVTANWSPGLWVTLPGNVAANSVSDFDRWLRQNTPPNVN